MGFPKQSDVEIPLLQVLRDAGGSARPRDVYPIVARLFSDLTQEEQEQRLESYPATRKWWNLVQWVRQRLVDAGEIDGSTRGVWKITTAGLSRLSGQAVQSEVSIVRVDAVTLRDLANQSRDAAKRRVLAELKQLTPNGFEHFCMELLQQLGYRNVAVTKRSGDGGIDGYGDFRQGAVSIKSAFQAKRWTEASVGRPDIDRLRGAIQGEFDHGVFITTSRFSKDAESASYKKGAISILLLDGNAITELMIDGGIGVRREPVYLYEVASEFFDFDADEVA